MSCWTEPNSKKNDKVGTSYAVCYMGIGVFQVDFDLKNSIFRHLSALTLIRSIHFLLIHFRSHCNLLLPFLKRKMRLSLRNILSKNNYLGSFITCLQKELERKLSVGRIGANWWKVELSAKRFSSTVILWIRLSNTLNKSLCVFRRK